MESRILNQEEIEKHTKGTLIEPLSRRNLFRHRHGPDRGPTCEGSCTTCATWCSGLFVLVTSVNEVGRSAMFGHNVWGATSRGTSLRIRKGRSCGDDGEVRRVLGARLDGRHVVGSTGKAVCAGHPATAQPKLSPKLHQLHVDSFSRATLGSFKANKK